MPAKGRRPAAPARARGKSRGKGGSRFFGPLLAFRLGGKQVRYLAVAPQRADPIERIELVKGDDDTAPIVVAVTVETRE